MSKKNAHVGITPLYSESNEHAAPKKSSPTRKLVFTFLKNKYPFLNDIKKELTHLKERAQKDRIRILWKNKRIAPDIPLPLFIAIEAAALLNAGIVRTALANTLGKVVLTVKVVNDATNAYDKGTNALQKKDYTSAIIHLTEATTKDVEYAEAFFELGLTHKALKDTKAAQEAFEKVISIGSNAKLARQAKEKLESNSTSKRQSSNK